ncbi:MAG TPA: glycosyltransferase family 4 protein [Terriglobales bacterium]|nr:glycosyltransferase family 4 protein [Terriglobales bacterium]
MKVLQICSARTIGGGERHFADLTNGLLARGHDVYAALRSDSDLHNELAGLSKCKIVSLRWQASFTTLNAFKLARFIRKHRIEIIHAHIAHDYLLALASMKLARRGRLVLTRHVLFPLNKVHKRLLRHSAQFIAVSNAVAASLRSEETSACPAIVVIHNGIDLNRFARHDTTSSFSSHTFRVGMVGHLGTIKGPEDFIRAAAIVASRRKDVTFVIAGEDKSRTGHDRRRLEQLVADLGLGSHVNLPGWIDNVPSLLATLDLMISPSRSEPFGLSIIEGMACGVPVIATASEGACEILEDGLSGKLVPIGDFEQLAEAIVGLLDNKEMRMNLAAQALKVVHTRFTITRMVDSTEQLYRDLLLRSM